MGAATDSRAGHKNFLLTGPPGCGKSTIIEYVVRRLNRPSTGFYTREIKVRGRRTGFSITTLDGRQGTMAHVDIRSRYRVGRYGIDLQSIDGMAVPAMIPGSEDEVVVVDEIGKMECLSALFRKTLIQVLDSANIVVGSIALKGDRFIGAVKSRPDTLVVMVTANNRNNLADLLMGLLPQGVYK